MGMKAGPFGDAAHALRFARQRAQLTQAKAATKAGISPRSLASYELADVAPTVEVFSRLLAAYGIETVEAFARMHAEAVGGSEPSPSILVSSPGQSAAFYRNMAAILDRIESLEREVRDSRAPASIQR